MKKSKPKLNGNPARKRLKKTNPALYRARRLRVSYKRLGVDRSTEDILKEIQSLKSCTYCNEPLDPLDISLDHILPSSRGGSDTQENLHLVCLGCNLVKGNLTDGEYKSLLEFMKDKPKLKEIIRRRLKASGFMFRG